jgi:hypothetical protein
VEAAKDYLTNVFNNKSLASTMRLAAIKLMRKSEARKVTLPSVQPVPDLATRLEAANKRIAESRIQMEKDSQ